MGTWEICKQDSGNWRSCMPPRPLLRRLFCFFQRYSQTSEKSLFQALIIRFCYRSPHQLSLLKKFSFKAYVINKTCQFSDPAPVQLMPSTAAILFIISEIAYWFSLMTGVIIKPGRCDHHLILIILIIGR